MLMAVVRVQEALVTPSKSHEGGSGDYISKCYTIKIKNHIENFLKVDEHKMEAGKRIPLTDIGAGVYPTTIFFNHSCAPNTVRINMGKRVSHIYFTGGQRNGPSPASFLLILDLFK